MALKNYAWATVESAANTVLQFVALVILTKFLTPTDYGVWGMMAIFIAVGNMLVDSGLGGALVKDKHPERIDYNTLFCFNMLVSVLFYLILFFSANAISRFYGVEELALYIRIYGLVIIISAFGIVQITQLVKTLRFKELAIVAIVANLLGIGVAVVMAVKGFHVWCLVAQQLVTMTVRVLLSFVFCRYVPRVEFSRKSLKKQFGFGGSILFSNLIGTIYGNIVSSIIPKIGTVAQNGYYLQAAKIKGVPQSILTSVVDKVVFPELSKKTEEEMLPEGRRIIRMIFPVVSLCFLGCICLAKPMVLIVLGKQWIESIGYLKILLFGGFGSVYMYLARSIYKASGKTSIILKTTIIKSLIGLAIIAVSTIWGVWGIVYGFVVISVVNSIVSSLYLKKYLDYPIKDQLLDLKYGLLIVIISIVCSVVIP